MSGFGERFRRAAAGLGGRRPGVELVRVDQPAPAAPSPRLALPAPELPLCPRCRTRHEPRPHPATSRGLVALYSRQVVPDSSRPQPLGRGPADPAPLLRDQASPWREGWER